MRRFPILLLLFAALLLFAGTARADEDPERVGPRIVFPAKSFNFGEVIQGQVVRHTFRFTNEGDAPLIIRKLKESCGCTEAALSKKELAPGESGQVEVAFDSTTRMAFQKVELYLYTNDPTQKDRGPYVTILKMQGNVGTLVDVMPPAVYLQSVLVGDTTEKQVAVLPKAGRLKVDRVEVSQPFIEVETAPLIQGDREGVQLTVRVTERTPPGKLEESIILHTDMKDQPQVRIPVLAMVNPEIVAFPSRIPFYEIPRAKGAARVLVLERVRGEGLEVLAVEANEAYFSWTIDYVVPGKRAEVEFNLKPGAPPGLFQEQAHIFLAHPEVPYVAVPLFGEVLSEVRTQPGGLFVQATEAMPGPVGTIHITSRTGTIAVDEIEPIGLNGFEVSTAPAGEGRIKLELTAANPAAGPVRGELVVRLTEPDETVRIQVLGQVEPAGEGAGGGGG